MNGAVDMEMKGWAVWHWFWVSVCPGDVRVNSRKLLFCLLLVKGQLNRCTAFIIDDSSHRKLVNVSVAFSSHLLSRGHASFCWLPWVWTSMRNISPNNLTSGDDPLQSWHHSFFLCKLLLSYTIHSPWLMSDCHVEGVDVIDLDLEEGYV